MLCNADNTNTPLSCQFQYIKYFGEQFIETCSWMFDCYEGDIFHITIVSDDWNQREDAPEFYIKKCRDKVVDFVKKYLPEFSAVGFVEFQRIETRTKDGKVGLIAMHCHMIVYGGELGRKRRKDIRKRCKRFSSSLTNKPIYFQTVTRTNNSKHRVYSYLIKHPTKKLVLSEGKENTKAAKRPISLKQQMRILEVLSYIPISSRVFGVGHGCAVKDQVLFSLNERKNQLADAEHAADEERKKEIWRDYWKVGRVKHFKHPIIHL